MAQEKELCIQEMARRICERRKQLRLTQEELAEMSDMTTQAVSYAESGKRAMRPDSLRKLAAALCVSADYLLTGDIVDKDLLILADKLRQLTPSQDTLKTKAKLNFHEGNGFRLFFILE